VLTQEEKEEKERRLKEWEEGTQKKPEGHQLVEERHNQDFVNYYKGLKILSEAEWDNFYSKLKEPLDICFRINSVEKNY
jgi:16S rRNA C967 or C1407 C5-methylase (RsmB/RsmF family)